MRQQPLQDSDRGRERRAHRAVLRPAVPPTLLQLLTEEPGDNVIDILIKVGTQYDGQTVDTGFDLAVEEWLTGVLPTTVFSDERHRSANIGATWVDAEVAQQHQTVCRGRPGLTREHPRLALPALLLI